MRFRLADPSGRVMLAGTPTQNADGSNLRRQVDLSAIFSDARIAQAWERDCAAIFRHWPRSEGRGSVNDGDCRAMYYLLSYLKLGRVTEIDTNVGRSAAYIATALPEGGKLTMIEIVDVNAADGPWSSGGEMEKPPRRIFERPRTRRRGRVRTIARTGLFKHEAEIGSRLPRWSHAHHDVKREICAALECLDQGGSILMHDYYPGGKSLFDGGYAITGPFRAVERFMREGGAFTVLPSGNLPWPTKQGHHCSSLPLVVRRG
jgi:hypothetical protein